MIIFAVVLDADSRCYMVIDPEMSFGTEEPTMSKPSCASKRRRGLADVGYPPFSPEYMSGRMLPNEHEAMIKAAEETERLETPAA